MRVSTGWRKGVSSPRTIPVRFALWSWLIHPFLFTVGASDADCESLGAAARLGGLRA